MIPHLDELLRMNEEGNMPMRLIVSHVVKYVALEGSKEDFAALSPLLRQAVIQKLDWYKGARGWLVVSNNGSEDYGRYAEMFLEKVGRDLSL